MKRRRDWEKVNRPFVAALETVLIECGAVTDVAVYYRLETKAGLLGLTVYPNTTEAGAWVAGRFKDVDAGRALTGDSNPYSGKWNHHYFTSDVEDAIRDLKHQLSRVR